MNILFIHETDWVNKVVFEMHNLAESLSAMGHTVYAIDYPNKWTKDTKCGEFKDVSRTTHGGHVTLIRPEFIKKPVISRVSAFATHYLAIKKTIKEKKIDVIVLYSVATNGLQTIELAREYKIPIVFRSIDVLNQLVPNKSLRMPTKMLESTVYKNVDMILTISPKLTEYVTNLGADDRKVHLLPLLVDTDLFCPSDREEDDGRTILFVGSLHDFSGLHETIMFFPMVLHKFPDARLMIVGDGNYKPMLEAYAKRMGIEEAVIFTGMKPYKTIPDYIRMSSICICPFYINDLTNDIFPSKIVQYMACAKPVICTPLDGVRALVSDGNGIVFRHLNNFVPVIQGLLTDRSLRNRIGSAGLGYVMQNNSHKIIAKRLEEYLMEAISDKRK
ncbi:MAG: glycosyltransferase family 4 protein [Nanoarchaeota archaeon]